jgi:hypothetical protein
LWRRGKPVAQSMVPVRSVLWIPEYPPGGSPITQGQQPAAAVHSIVCSRRLRCFDLKERQKAVTLIDEKLQQKSKLALTGNRRGNPRVLPALASPVPTHAKPDRAGVVPNRAADHGGGGPGHWEAHGGNGDGRSALRKRSLWAEPANPTAVTGRQWLQRIFLIFTQSIPLR